MLSVELGGRVYGPGVFMSLGEAEMVKRELMRLGSATSKKLADEISMPSDGRVCGGETHFGDISPKGWIR